MKKAASAAPVLVTHLDLQEPGWRLVTRPPGWEVEVRGAHEIAVYSTDGAPERGELVFRDAAGHSTKVPFIPLMPAEARTTLHAVPPAIAFEGDAGSHAPTQRVHVEVVPAYRRRWLSAPAQRAGQTDSPPVAWQWDAAGENLTVWPRRTGSARGPVSLAGRGGLPVGMEVTLGLRLSPGTVWRAALRQRFWLALTIGGLGATLGALVAFLAFPWIAYMLAVWLRAPGLTWPAVSLGLIAGAYLTIFFWDITKNGPMGCGSHFILLCGAVGSVGAIYGNYEMVYPSGGLSWGLLGMGLVWLGMLALALAAACFPGIYIGEAILGEGGDAVLICTLAALLAAFVGHFGPAAASCSGIFLLVLVLLTAGAAEAWTEWPWVLLASLVVLAGVVLRYGGWITAEVGAVVVPAAFGIMPALAYRLPHLPKVEQAELQAPV
jgi:hypothetical protein